MGFLQNNENYAWFNQVGAIGGGVAGTISTGLGTGSGANITSGGVSQGVITHISTDILLFHKIAFKYKLNDVALWINGIEVATQTSATMPIGLNQLNLANGDGIQNYLQGKAKAVAVFPILTDAQLQELTTI